MGLITDSPKRTLDEWGKDNNTLYVGPGCDIKTVQAAVDAAAAGDLVVAKTGTRLDDYTPAVGVKITREDGITLPEQGVVVSERTFAYDTWQSYSSESRYGCDGTNTHFTTSVRHTLTFDCRRLSAMFGNVSRMGTPSCLNASLQESYRLSPIRISALIRHQRGSRVIYYPLHFGGDRYTTIYPGAYAKTDPLEIDCLSTDTIRLLTCVRPTSQIQNLVFTGDWSDADSTFVLTMTDANGAGTHSTASISGKDHIDDLQTAIDTLLSDCGYTGVVAKVRAYLSTSAWEIRNGCSITFYGTTYPPLMTAAETMHSGKTGDIVPTMFVPGFLPASTSASSLDYTAVNEDWTWANLENNPDNWSAGEMPDARATGLTFSYYTACCLLGEPIHPWRPRVGVLGDSVASVLTAQKGTSAFLSSFYSVAPAALLASPGDTITSLLSDANRLKLAKGFTGVVCNYGRNDLRRTVQMQVIDCVQTPSTITLTIANASGSGTSSTDAITYAASADCTAAIQAALRALLVTAGYIDSETGEQISCDVERHTSGTPWDWLVTFTGAVGTTLPLMTINTGAASSAVSYWDGTSKTSYQNCESLSSWRTRLVALWTRMCDEGARVWQSTITPWSVANMVTAGYYTTHATEVEANRQRANTWIRTLPAPLTGILEMATAVEDETDSSVWATGLSDDGIHPNATGAAAMKAVTDAAAEDIAKVYV